MLIILKQRIDTVNVERDVYMHNQEEVFGMETDAVCVPQVCEPEVSHILRSFLWWWFFIYIILCGFTHMELLRLVDLLSCLSGALHLLQC